MKLSVDSLEKAIKAIDAMADKNGASIRKLHPTKMLIFPWMQELIAKDFGILCRFLEVGGVVEMREGQKISSKEELEDHFRRLLQGENEGEMRNEEGRNKEGL